VGTVGIAVGAAAVVVGAVVLLYARRSGVRQVGERPAPPVTDAWRRMPEWRDDAVTVPLPFLVPVMLVRF
jgi:hypothetical protein